MYLTYCYTCQSLYMSVSIQVQSVFAIVRLQLYCRFHYSIFGLHTYFGHLIYWLACRSIGDGNYDVLFKTRHKYVQLGH